MQCVLQNIQSGMDDRMACLQAGYSKESVRRRKEKIFARIEKISPGSLDTAKWHRDQQCSPESIENTPNNGRQNEDLPTPLPIKLEAGDDQSIVLSQMKPHHLAFFKAIANGMSEGEAMRASGLSNSYSRNPKEFKRNIANKLGKTGILSAMQAFGLNEATVMEVAMELRHGTKHIPVSRIDDTIKYKEVPDLGARNDFLKFWQKMFELVGDDEEDHSEHDFLLALDDAKTLDNQNQ